MSDESNSTFFVCPACDARSLVGQLNVRVRIFTRDPAYDHLIWFCPTPDCPVTRLMIVSRADLLRCIELGYEEDITEEASMQIRIYIRRMLSRDPATHFRPGTSAEIMADIDNFVDTLKTLDGVDEFLYRCA